MKAGSAYDPGPRGDWDWQVVFDGGSLGNPGKGYGSFCLRPQGAAWSEPVRHEFGDAVTNNEAEYLALIAALEAVHRNLTAPERVKVLVLGDSQLVVRQLRGEWKVRAANLRPYVQAVHRIAEMLGQVEYRWHSRDRSVELLGH